MVDIMSILKKFDNIRSVQLPFICFFWLDPDITDVKRADNFRPDSGVLEAFKL